MLVFGFGFTPEENVFDEDDVAAAIISFVTDTGVRVSGPAKTPHEVRAVQATDSGLSAALAAEARRIRDELNDEDVPSGVQTVTATIPEPAGLSETKRAKECAARFAQAVLRGEVRRSDPDSFVATAQMVNVQLREEFLATYVPRDLAGRSDVEVLRRLGASEKSVLIEGPPGTGKTSSCIEAFGRDLVIVQCSRTTTNADLVGVNQPSSGDAMFEWIDGPLVKAMRQGRPFLLDDAGALHPGVQTMLHPVCDSRRSLDVIDRPGQQHILAEPGFTLLCTSNPGEGEGLTGPLRDRMAAVITVPTDFELARQLRVPSVLVEVAQQLHARAEDDLAEGISHWVPSLRELLDARDVADVLDEFFAAHALVSKCQNLDDQKAAIGLFRHHLGDDTFATNGPLTSGGKYDTAPASW